MLPSLLSLTVSFFQVLVLPLPQKFNCFRFHIPCPMFYKKCFRFRLLKKANTSEFASASFFKVLPHKNLTASASLARVDWILNSLFSWGTLATCNHLHFYISRVQYKAKKFRLQMAKSRLLNGSYTHNFKVFKGNL